MYYIYLYTLSDVLHRLIFLAGRKFHCPFFLTKFSLPPFLCHTPLPPLPRTPIIARQLGHVRRESFETFSFDFLSFRFVFGFFHLPPLTFQSLLCKLYLFLFLVYFYIYISQVFLLLFHRFARHSFWHSPHCHFPRYMHDICLAICLSGLRLCQSQLPDTVSYADQAARRVLSTNLVSLSLLTLLPVPISLSLFLLFIYNIFLFKMKPQATPNY